MATEPEDDVQKEIVSGPYCEHWSDPSDCDEPCTCKHPCKRHSSGEECDERGCECKKFELAEDP